jgi:hypothetical protein
MSAKSDAMRGIAGDSVMPSFQEAIEEAREYADEDNLGQTITVDERKVWSEVREEELALAAVDAMDWDELGEFRDLEDAITEEDLFFAEIEGRLERVGHIRAVRW